MAILSPEDGPVRTPSLHGLLELLPVMVREDPMVVAATLRDQYGRLVRVPPLHPAIEDDVYLVSDPEDVRYILQTDPKRFEGIDVSGSRDFERVMSNSMASQETDSEREAWLQRVRMTGPEFRESHAEGHVNEYARTTASTMAEFEAGSDDPSAVTVPDAARVTTDVGDGVRLAPAMRRLGLRLLGVSLFGPDIRAHETDVIDSVATLRALFKRRQLHMVTSHVTRRFPSELRVPKWLREPLGVDPHVELRSSHHRQGEAAIDTLVEVAEAMVARRQRTPNLSDDALGTWLRRADPVTGDHLSPEALEQEVMGLIIAGYATMSAGLAWAFSLLAARPGVQKRIHDEARRTDLLAGPDGPREGPEPGDEFLDALPYTERVWKETLRLYPPLPVFGRTACDDITLSGQSLDAGTHVLVSPYVIHRDPDFWEEPETFDPDRFLPEHGADRPEFAFIPFSAGPHACRGRSIAMTEALVVLSTVLATHRVEFAGPDADGPHDGPDVGIDSAINLQPDRDIVVRFVPREQD